MIIVWAPRNAKVHSDQIYGEKEGDALGSGVDIIMLTSFKFTFTIM